MQMETPIFSPHTSALLHSLQPQQGGNTCGPCSVATVANALCGLHLEGAVLAQEMNRIAWRGWKPVVRRIPNWATFPWGMVDVFRQYGLAAAWRFLATGEELQEGLKTRDVLMPVIGSWRPPWAHVMTLVAWHPFQGWGFANTQRSQPEIDWLPGRRFYDQWSAFGRILVRIQDPDSAQERTYGIG